MSVRVRERACVRAHARMRALVHVGACEIAVQPKIEEGNRVILFRLQWHMRIMRDSFPLQKRPAL